MDFVLAVVGRAGRIEALLADGYPAYTTGPGWLGYSDEKMARLARAAVDDGFRLIKLKVGGSLEDDIRRLRVARAPSGTRSGSPLTRTNAGT